METKVYCFAINYCERMAQEEEHMSKIARMIHNDAASAKRHEEMAQLYRNERADIIDKMMRETGTSFEIAMCE